MNMDAAEGWEFIYKILGMYCNNGQVDGGSGKEKKKKKAIHENIRVGETHLYGVHHGRPWFSV